MPLDSDDEVLILENVEEVLEGLAKELQELYDFRDLYFERHSIDTANDKIRLVGEKQNALIEKFEEIDVENQIPFALRAKFLYMKGRLFNIKETYDLRATQCLSKAVKLCPHMVEAWNELGESYWKNMSIAEAKASFEGALRHERNPLSLRCLSIIMRQECTQCKSGEAKELILKSVDLAKEAVSIDIKDGASWTILGNAYLCQFFMVKQDMAILKLCMSAYKQAITDPIARGQPDLYFNKGMALKFEESYEEALETFEYATKVDPMWDNPKAEITKLVQYLSGVNDLVRTKGKVKNRKLMQMVQSIDDRMFGVYTPGQKVTFGTRKVDLEHVSLQDLPEGPNLGKVVIGKVVGSIHSENVVPFTFAMVDKSLSCVTVTVYNLADGRGVIIGDTVAMPEPPVTRHQGKNDALSYDFKSIRVNNPMQMLVNGKRVGPSQYASIRVTSTYEIH